MMLNAYILNLFDLRAKCFANIDQASLNSQNFYAKSKNSNIENKINKLNSPDFLKKSEYLNFTSVKEPTKYENPHSKITSINTEILIRKGEKNGYVSETVRFKLDKGVFNSVIRKISLAGTADKFFGFKLASA